MSENQNRGIRDFSKYESMATEELEEILRLDAEAPEEQGSDTELILYVMEVLANRRNTNITGNTAQKAWESFQQNYLPEVEEGFDYTSEHQKTTKLATPWLRRLVAAAAVIALLICVPAITSAVEWEHVWNAVAKWTKETFSFVSSVDDPYTAPATEDVLQYSSLQQALTQADLSFDAIPTWIPERYELKDVTVEELPGRKAITAYYRNGEKLLMLRVQSYISSDAEKAEINETLIEVFEAFGTKFYIFSNNEQLRIIWAKGFCECYVSGELTLEEAKTMINSIGKG